MTFTCSRWIKQQTLVPVVISLQCTLCQLFQLYNTSRWGKNNDISTAGLGENLLFCELVAGAMVPIQLTIWLPLKKLALSASFSVHHYAKYIWRQNLFYLFDKILVSKVHLCQHPHLDIIICGLVVLIDRATKGCAIIVSLFFSKGTY